jgi:hypothetical protein
MMEHGIYDPTFSAGHRVRVDQINSYPKAAGFQPGPSNIDTYEAGLSQFTSLAAWLN